MTPQPVDGAYHGLMQLIRGDARGAVNQIALGGKGHMLDEAMGRLTEQGSKEAQIELRERIRGAGQIGRIFTGDLGIFILRLDLRVGPTVRSGRDPNSRPLDRIGHLDRQTQKRSRRRRQVDHGRFGALAGP